MPIDPSSGLPTLDVGMMRQHVSELVERNGWSRAQLLNHQRQELRRALGHAVASSAYYREMIGELVAHDAPLTAMPVLTKRLLMDSFDRIITDHRLSRALIEQHLDGNRPGDLLLGEYRTAATGGTTGERGIFVYDQRAWASTVAGTVRFQRVLGVWPETRSIGIMASSPIHLSARFQAETHAIRPASPRLDLSMPLAEIVTALNTYQPEVIATYPSFIRVLAEEQLTGRLCIAPRIVRSAAEALSEPVRGLARAAWQLEVVDSYASTEVGAMGQECAHLCGIHLAEDLCVFENADEDGRPVAEGEPGARLLVTTLTNRTLPLVRYELTDMVALTSEPCGCGLPFARIRTIDGRKEEVLQFPGRHGGGISVHAGRLRSPLLRTAGVRQVQLVPLTDGLEILIVVEPGHDPDATCSRAEEAVRSTLADLGAATSVQARAVEQIMRTGAGAKEKLIGVSGRA
jgi:putative adenylate-forming enzyme